MYNLKQFTLSFKLLSLSILLIVNISQGNPPTKIPLLVSTEWLSEQLDNPSLVLLHIDRRGAYDEKHIPGANYISLRGLIERKSKDNLSDEIPSATKLDSIFGSLGINEKSLIVIYYGNEMLIPSASRLFLTVDYFGLGENTHILNGGLTSWITENRPTSADVSNTKSSNISANLKEDLLVGADWVFQNLRTSDIVIIDARPEEQYSGEEKDHKSRKVGHITGAVNIPFYELTQKESPHLFLSDTELEKRFMEAGIKVSSTIITYCGTGIWASPVYVAAKHLGYTVKFYDGSFEDWSAHPDFPVTGPVKRGWFK